MDPPMLQARIGAIGDVHAEDRLLASALDTLAAAGASTVLCVGDLADGTGSLGRCLDLLRERNVAVVRGNHDRWQLGDVMRDLPNATDLAALSTDHREYLAGLPPTMEFSTPFGGLLLCHGLGANDMVKVAPDDHGYALDSNDELQKLMADPKIRFVVNGHSHRVMVRHFPADPGKSPAGELTILNAGTLKADHDPGFLL